MRVECVRAGAVVRGERCVCGLLFFRLAGVARWARCVVSQRWLWEGDVAALLSRARIIYIGDWLCRRRAFWRSGVRVFRRLADGGRIHRCTLGLCSHGARRWLSATRRGF